MRLNKLNNGHLVILTTGANTLKVRKNALQLLIKRGLTSEILNDILEKLSYSVQQLPYYPRGDDDRAIFYILARSILAMEECSIELLLQILHHHNEKNVRLQALTAIINKIPTMEKGKWNSIYGYITSGTYTEFTQKTQQALAHAFVTCRFTGPRDLCNLVEGKKTPITMRRIALRVLVQHPGTTPTLLRDINLDGLEDKDKVWFAKKFIAHPNTTLSHLGDACRDACNLPLQRLAARQILAILTVHPRRDIAGEYKVLFHLACLRKSDQQSQNIRKQVVKLYLQRILPGITDYGVLKSMMYSTNGMGDLQVRVFNKMVAIKTPPLKDLVTMVEETGEVGLRALRLLALDPMVTPTIIRKFTSTKQSPAIREEAIKILATPLMVFLDSLLTPPVRNNIEHNGMAPKMAAV